MAWTHGLRRTPLSPVLGHADRLRPFQDYCVGLLSVDGCKSVEPLAALTGPGWTAAQHQSLLHFMAQGRGNADAGREQVLPAIIRADPIEALIADDARHVKRGKPSVGVARQYCGERGKKDKIARLRSACQ